MIQTTKTLPIGELRNLISDAIEKRFTEVADEEFEEAKKRIDKRKHEIITGVALEVHKLIEFETFKDSLIIKVKLD